MDLNLYPFDEQYSFTIDLIFFKTFFFFFFRLIRIGNWKMFEKRFRVNTKFKKYQTTKPPFLSYSILR